MDRHRDVNCFKTNDFSKSRFFLLSVFGVMAMQLSTLRQLCRFPLLSSVLSLVCCLCEWEAHHLAIVWNVISPPLPRSSSVSVSMNTTIRGSVWPSGRLHSDYMSEVSKTTASNPVHNVSAGCWADSWCLHFWRERFLHTKDFPETTHLKCL